MADDKFYSIDTSALLEAFVRRYPPDIWPALWDEKLDELIDTGRLVAAYEVLEDLSKRDDDIHEWAKIRTKMFIDLDQYEPQLIKVMSDYPRLVDTKTGKSGSDPMVIALASAQRLTVVSEEGMGSANSPKIPYVCNQIGIRHVNFLAFIREQQWMI